MTMMQFLSREDQVRMEEVTNYTYQETDQLSLSGGYMIVYLDECHITMNAHLPNDVKEQGRLHMLNHRQQLEVQSGGIYIWRANELNDSLSIDISESRVS